MSVEDSLTGIAADGGAMERAEALASLVSTAREFIGSAAAERYPLGTPSKLSAQRR